MDLLRREQRPVAHSQGDPDLSVDGIETLENFRLVIRDLNTGNALNKGMTTNANQSWKTARGDASCPRLKTLTLCPQKRERD